MNDVGPQFQSQKSIFDSTGFDLEFMHHAREQAENKWSEGSTVLNRASLIPAVQAARAMLRPVKTKWIDKERVKELEGRIVSLREDIIAELNKDGYTDGMINEADGRTWRNAYKSFSVRFDSILDDIYFGRDAIGAGILSKYTPSARSKAELMAVK